MPPGWTYCPSTYLQRLPIVALGAVGFVIARVLAVYQLGHVEGRLGTVLPRSGRRKRY